MSSTLQITVCSFNKLGIFTIAIAIGIYAENQTLLNHPDASGYAEHRTATFANPALAARF